MKPLNLTLHAFGPFEGTQELSLIHIYARPIYSSQRALYPGGKSGYGRNS